MGVISGTRRSEALCTALRPTSRGVGCGSSSSRYWFTNSVASVSPSPASIASATICSSIEPGRMSLLCPPEPGFLSPVYSCPFLWHAHTFPSTW